MSVYKEGYSGLALIIRKSITIFADAADYGAPTKRGDTLWNTAKQIADWYGTKNTRVLYDYTTGKTIEIIVELMDEWDTGRVEQFKICYITCNTGRCKGYEGYLQVMAMEGTSMDLLNSFLRRS